MAFKVQRVSKVKALPTLPGPSNKENSLNDDKDNQSQLRGSACRPKVPDKPHGDVNHSKRLAGSDHNQNKSEKNLYAYAGVEFRPLQITEEGAFSTAIIQGHRHISQEMLQELPSTYEEVTLSSGNFDKINQDNILVKCRDNAASDNAVAAYSTDMEHHTREIQTDTYAEVDTSYLAKKKPPPMPKPYSKSKDNVDVANGGKKKPPPPPKPYAIHKEEEHTDEPVMEAVYAVVNKQAKTSNLVDLNEPEQDEAPPPLPDRPNFEAEENLRKSQEDLIKDEAHHDKGNKGSSILKTIKKHIRQKSDGSQSKKSSEHGSTESKKGASSEDLTAADSKSSKPVKAYLVTDIVSQPSTEMFGEPEMYEPVSEMREEEKLLKSSSDLPDGWQEVKDHVGRTYYWHVASGNTQWGKPKILESTVDSSSQHSVGDHVKPKPKPELITVTSFPVHSMGWLELEESQVAPHNMTDTIAECISNLARERKDLWKTSETWGGGKDLRLLLESDNLKLVDCQTKTTLLLQPISKMRVWGAGRDEQKDFAYVARDQVTGKHKCHVFRCHGNISGRAIHVKLHEMCNKILAEKKRARDEQQNSSSKQWSDILNTPPKPSVKGRK